MWIEDLSNEKRILLNKICGSLGIPPLLEYQREEHVLSDIYSRIIETKGLIRQALSKLNCDN